MKTHGARWRTRRFGLTRSFIGGTLVFTAIWWRQAWAMKTQWPIWGTITTTPSASTTGKKGWRPSPMPRNKFGISFTSFLTRRYEESLTTPFTEECLHHGGWSEGPPQGADEFCMMEATWVGPTFAGATHEIRQGQMWNQRDHLLNAFYHTIPSCRLAKGLGPIVNNPSCRLAKGVSLSWDQQSFPSCHSAGAELATYYSLTVTTDLVCVHSCWSWTSIFIPNIN